MYGFDDLNIDFNDLDMDDNSNKDEVSKVYLKENKDAIKNL